MLVATELYDDDDDDDDLVDDDDSISMDCNDAVLNACNSDNGIRDGHVG